MSVIDYEIQLQLAKQNNKVAFELLVQRYERMIISIAARILRNYEDARDLTQDVLIKAHTGLHKCNDIYNFKNWLCRITTNACIDELRKRKKSQAVSIDTGISLYIQAGTATLPEAVVIKRERNNDIVTALSQLPKKQNALIVMRYINGYNYNEIAHAMDMNTGTVKSNLFRARNQLKNLLLEGF